MSMALGPDEGHAALSACPACVAAPSAERIAVNFMVSALAVQVERNVEKKQKTEQEIAEAVAAFRGAGGHDREV